MKSLMRMHLACWWRRVTGRDDHAPLSGPVGWHLVLSAPLYKLTLTTPRHIQLKPTRLFHGSAAGDSGAARDWPGADARRPIARRAARCGPAPRASWLRRPISLTLEEGVAPHTPPPVENSHLQSSGAVVNGPRELFNFHPCSWASRDSPPPGLNLSISDSFSSGCLSIRTDTHSITFFSMVSRKILFDSILLDGIYALLLLYGAFLISEEWLNFWSLVVLERKLSKNCFKNDSIFFSFVTSCKSFSSTTSR